MISTQWMIIGMVFASAFFGALCLLEAFAVRKDITLLNKEIKPLYREDAYKEKGPVQRLAAWVDRSEYGEELEKELKGANLKITPFQWISIYVGSLIMISYIINVVLSVDAPYNFLIGYLVVKVIAKQWFKSRRSKLVQKVNEQLPEVCRLMASCVRAGLSLQQAIDIAAKQMKPPVGELYGTMARELKLGMAMEVVLERLNQRVNSKDLKLMNNTMIIQRRAGGNLSEALEQVSMETVSMEQVLTEMVSTEAI